MSFEVALSRKKSGNGEAAVLVCHGDDKTARTVEMQRVSICAVDFDEDLRFVLRKYDAQQQRDDSAPDAASLKRGLHRETVYGCGVFLVTDSTDGDRLAVQPREILHALVGF